MLSRNQKAVIHVAKHKIGMDEEEYRALLSSFGVTTSCNLDDHSFQTMMQHFEKLGFKSKFAAKAKHPESKTRLLAKIYAIRSAMNLTEGYIDAIARRMYRTDSHKWLDAGQLHKLVAALTYHQRKAEKP